MSVGGYVALLASVLWCSAVAAAEAASDDARMEHARASEAENAFAVGAEAFERGDTQQALVQMRRAFELAPDYRSAAGLGQVELELKRYRAAAEHLEFSLRSYPRQATAEVRASVMRGFAQARAHVGTITLHSQHLGVTLSIDGKPSAKLPVAHDLFVEPGVRRFGFSKPGHKSLEREVTVRAGGVHTINAEPGERLLAAEAPSAQLPEPAAPSARGWVLLGGGTLAVLALGSGVVFSLDASEANARAADLRLQLPGGCSAADAPLACDELKQQSQRVEDSKLLAVGSFAGAAALSLLTVGVWAWLAEEPQVGSGQGSWAGGASAFTWSAHADQTSLEVAARGHF